jgi:hypothetical protein
MMVKAPRETGGRAGGGVVVDCAGAVGGGVWLEPVGATARGVAWPG